MTFVFGMVIDWKLAPRPCRLCILVFPFLVHSTDSQSFGMTVNRSPFFLSFSVGFYYGNDAVQRQAPQHASLQKLPERRAGLCDWLIVIFNGESCTSTSSVVMPSVVFACDDRNPFVSSIISSKCKESKGEA